MKMVNAQFHGKLTTSNASETRHHRHTLNNISFFSSVMVLMLSSDFFRYVNSIYKSLSSLFIWYGNIILLSYESLNAIRENKSKDKITINWPFVRICINQKFMVMLWQQHYCVAEITSKCIKLVCSNLNKFK